jgi:hypothetical protein
MSRLKGNPKTGGRKAGTPNKLTRDIKEMILGALNAKGGQAWLEAQMVANPVAFLTLLGKVLPLQVSGEDGGLMVIKLVHYGRGPTPAPLET